VLSGIATLLSFASSSETVSAGSLGKWLAFGAGAVGTMSLVLQLFAGYSERTTRARTRDLNAILRMADITPMPPPTQTTSGSIDEEAAPAAQSVRAAVKKLEKA